MLACARAVTANWTSDQSDRSDKKPRSVVPARDTPARRIKNKNNFGLGAPFGNWHSRPGYTPKSGNEFTFKALRGSHQNFFGRAANPFLSMNSYVVGLSQELFLVRDDLRERVCVQYAVLGLVRKTGSDGLVK